MLVLYALRGLTMDVLIILEVKGGIGASSADWLTLRGGPMGLPHKHKKGVHVSAAAGTD